MEALVRWNHPDHGLIYPNDFIPAAESTSLINDLTNHVIDQALAQARSWTDRGHRVPVAVNLSARCLLDSGLPERVGRMLVHHRVAASQLRLELTESALMTDPTRAQEVLTRFRRQGIRLSVDDFGTGYSSMSYLKTLPVDEVKIARSFIADMRADGNDALVRSVIDLAHNLGLAVVAEGVEDEATLTQLADLGCDVVQGLVLARAQPAADVTTLLDTTTA